MCENLNFDKQKFLKLHYQNIQIESNSTFNIRTNPKTGGELKFSFLFLNLCQELSLINVKKIALKEYNGVYIIPTEPWYTPDLGQKLNSIGKNY